MNKGKWLIFGVWIAAAIKTFSYTWQSFSQTYSQFPDTTNPQSGAVPPTSGQAIGAGIQGIASGIPVVGGVLGTAIQGWRDIFSATGRTLSPGDAARLEKLPAPPPQLVKAFLVAFKKNPNPQSFQTSNTLASLSSWCMTHGWQPKDFNNFLIYLGAPGNIVVPIGSNY